MAARYPDNYYNTHTKRFLNVAEESGRIMTPIQGYDKQPLVSLEQAIEPIISYVPDVKRMAYTAKVKCGKPPANNLSIDESASILLYSMEWEPQEECLYHVLNKTLRTENRKQLKPWFPYLKLILTALFRLPSSSRSVFRGVRCDMRKYYREGATVYWWGFSSCTTKMGVLKNEDFLGSSGPRTMFAIECFSGKDIRQHSHFQDEVEILLAPGRQFKVVSSLDQGNGLYLIQLKETEPPYPLLEPILQDTHPMPDSALNNHVSADTFPTKSIRMARWEISDQYGGITDTMRVNILSTISTSIDTHGTSDMYAIAKAVKGWLDEIHGPEWTVIVGEDGKYRSAFTSSNSQYLRVKETRLGWRIVIFKQATP